MTSGIAGPALTTSTDYSTWTWQTPPWKALLPRVLDRPSGVFRGHDELRRFFVLGTADRLDDLVRWYRTGQYLFNGHLLIWEYPRQAPEWEQVDLVKVMELTGPRIVRHRIYRGWTALLISCPGQPPCDQL
jgi:hypothetical protein